MECIYLRNYLSGIRIVGSRIKTKLFFSFGADKLNHEFLQFSAMHLMYMLATSITMIFINTLLMRVSADPNIALKYNIVHWVFVGLSMTWAALSMRWLNNKIVITIGILLSMSTYLLTLIFMNSLDSVYALVAIVHGIATGFYWITYFNTLLIYSHDDTRDIAMSFLGFFTGVISLIMPMFSGYVIQFLPGFVGYYVIFGLCFGLAGLALYLVFRLPTIPASKRKTQFRLLMKKIYTEKIWFFVIHMDFFKGIREGAFSFFLNVLLFEIVKSEGLIGTNTFLISIVSMISSIVAGKVMRPKNRIKFMFLSTTLLTIFTSLLFLNLSVMTILILSVVNSFFGIFLINPTTTTLYTVLETDPNAQNIKPEVFSITECYKNVGRILGVTLIILLPKENFYYVLSLAILSATQYLTVLFAKITLDTVKKYKTIEK